MAEPSTKRRRADSETEPGFNDELMDVLRQHRADGLRTKVEEIMGELKRERSRTQEAVTRGASAQTCADALGRALAEVHGNLMLLLQRVEPEVAGSVGDLLRNCGTSSFVEDYAFLGGDSAYYVAQSGTAVPPDVLSRAREIKVALELLESAISADRERVASATAPNGSGADFAAVIERAKAAAEKASSDFSVLGAAASKASKKAEVAVRRTEELERELRRERADRGVAERSVARLQRERLELLKVAAQRDADLHEAKKALGAGSMGEAGPLQGVPAQKEAPAEADEDGEVTESELDRAKYDLEKNQALVKAYSSDTARLQKELATLRSLMLTSNSLQGGGVPTEEQIRASVLFQNLEARAAANEAEVGRQRAELIETRAAAIALDTQLRSQAQALESASAQRARELQEEVVAYRAKSREDGEALSRLKLQASVHRDAEALRRESEAKVEEALKMTRAERKNAVTQALRYRAERDKAREQTAGLQVEKRGAIADGGIVAGLREELDKATWRDREHAREKRELLSLAECLKKDREPETVDQAQLSAEAGSLRAAVSELSVRVKELEACGGEDIKAELAEKEELAVSLQEELDALMEEIESSSKTLEDCEKLNDQLRATVKEKESAAFKQDADRMKRGKQVELLREKACDFLTGTGIAERHAHEAEAHLKDRDRLAAKLQQEIDERAVQVTATEHHKRGLEAVIEGLRQESAAFAARLAEKEAGMQRAKDAIRESAMAGEKARGQATELGQLNKMLTAQLERMRDRLRGRNMADEEGEVAVLEEQVREAESKIKCGICSKREKSVALTKCGHAFCESCIQDRIDARDRRCPGCARVFSATDVLQLYLVS